MIIDGKEIVVRGTFPRVARLRAEYYEWVSDPAGFAAASASRGLKADLLTLLQKPDGGELAAGIPVEWDSIAVLPLTTYDHWWTKQINVKTRNMIRKAQKCGVEVREVPFSDELVAGIKVIYDESPLRQGKPFKHYGKDLATLKDDHVSYVERSTFIGAFSGGQLIGFAKVVHGDGMSQVMQIISMLAHRDKAPTNALLAKAVEICTTRGVPRLHYGVWSKRGLGDFKKHHAFERLDLARYYIPLTVTGRVALALKLHHRISQWLPESWADRLVAVRGRWNALRTARRSAG